MFVKQGLKATSFYLLKRLLAFRGLGTLPRARQRQFAEGRLLSLSQAADYLGVPAESLAPYLRATGNLRLPAEKVRGRWAIDLSTFQDWLIRLYEAGRTDTVAEQLFRREAAKTKRH
jgi:hypothetical protein